VVTRPPVVLASRSPQRRAILTALGIEFEAVAPEVEELREGAPREVVLENARRKARAGLATAPPGAIVIGCDTEVVLDGAVQGKPADEAAARAQLQALSGREHEVISGLCLLGPGDAAERSGVAVSRVRFRDLDGEAIERYLATGEWRERAGGYAIQGLGSALIDRVEGDVANVIGLPTGLLWQLAPELFTPAR
jgi:septum formation protein